MVRIATCTECNLRTAVWGSPPFCIAHLDAGETERTGRLLTPEEVAALRADRAAGLSWTALGRKYGRHPSKARLCALGLSYKAAA